MKTLKLLIIFLFLPAALFAEDQPWHIFKSTHFLVYYHNAKESMVNDVALKAESCYNKITDELGFRRFDFWTWDNRAKIYLFDDQQEYMKATNEPSWSAGQAEIENKLVQTFITAQGFLDSVLPHELSHIIFREMVGFYNPGIPLWLDEGVASYQQKDNSFVKAELARRISQGNFISFEELNNFDVMSLKSTNSVDLFYTESYSLVKYLISEFGKDKFVLFCQDMRDRKDLLRALRRVYSFNSLADFEASWKKYILK